MRHLFAEPLTECRRGVSIIELALTSGRHDTYSKLTSTLISQSLFPNTVDGVMDIKSHIKVIDQTLERVPKGVTCIVYITGLAILMQALNISWMKRVNAIDYPVLKGKLILAHWNRESQSYKLLCSESGIEWFPPQGSRLIQLPNLTEKRNLGRIIV
jgi:hypothetical protein